LIFKSIAAVVGCLKVSESETLAATMMSGSAGAPYSVMPGMPINFQGMIPTQQSMGNGPQYLGMGIVQPITA